MLSASGIPKKGRSLDRQEILVVGLGRFGRALARTLLDQGHEVLGVDADATTVQAASRELRHVIQADATDTAAMREIGAHEFKTGVVAIGSDLEASIIATYILVDMGLPRVWAKAITASHGAILERVGAHRVVFPEREMGERIAHSLIGRTIDYLELDSSFVLLETSVPEKVAGMTLAAAEIRSKYGLTVVSVKKGNGPFGYATAETVLDTGDVIVVAGEPRNAEKVASLD